MLLHFIIDVDPSYNYYSLIPARKFDEMSGVCALDASSFCSLGWLFFAERAAWSQPAAIDFAAHEPFAGRHRARSRSKYLFSKRHILSVQHGPFFACPRTVPAHPLLHRSFELAILRTGIW